MEHKTNNRLIHIFVLLALASLTLAACNVPGLQQATPTLMPTDEPTEVPTETEMPVLTPEAPTQEPEPTEEASVCVAPGSASLPDVSPAFDEYGDTFAEYLSAGGDVEQLRETLIEWGAIRQEEGTEFGGVNAEHDLTGDGVNDVIISAVDVDAEPLIYAPPGEVFVYTCVDGEYRLDYSDGGEDPMVDSVPDVIALDDFTGDEVADLLYSISSCGAHTCYTNVHGIFWDAESGGREPLLMIEPPISEPYSDISVSDVDDDGVMEVAVSVGMIGSVGAGPQRTYRDVYDWDGMLLTRVEHEATSPAHPIHLVNDADMLMYEGDYAQSITLFRRSYEDPSLDREWGFYDGWEEDLEAYARYRIMLAHVALGDSEQAESVYDALMADFPNPDEPGGLFAQWADLFWSQYSATGSAEQGCAAVYDSIDIPDFQSNPINQFGYANRSYTPEEMCRLLDED